MQYVNSEHSRQDIFWESLVTEKYWIRSGGKKVIVKMVVLHVFLLFCTIFTSQQLLRIKVTPDLHLTYSKNGENLGLVLKMKNIACISILLTNHVKYTYLYLFKTALYSIVAF